MLMTGISTPSRSGAIRWRSVLLALALMTWSAAASAQRLPQLAQLYGTATGLTPVGAVGPSSLYTIDPATAGARRLGPIVDPNLVAFRSVTGLAFLGDGTLLGSAIGDGLPGCVGACAVLIEIDPEPALVVVTPGTDPVPFIFAEVIGGPIGSAGVPDQCGRVADLSFDLTTGTLYGYSTLCHAPPVAEGVLMTIDLGTGLGTRSPNGSGFSGLGKGLASEPATGALFATPGQFITLDAATGVGTAVGSPPPPNTIVEGLAFDPLTGVLYGSRRRPNGGPDNNTFRDWFLVTIDPVTGATTEIATFKVPGATLDGVDALAFQAPAGCPWLPLGSCTDAERASLGLRAKDGQLKLELKKLGATDKTEFGDPVDAPLDETDGTTDYAVCLYYPGDGDPSFAGGYAVPASANWREGSNGFQFKSKIGDPNGITSVKLSAGASGKAKVSVKGRVTIPDLPLPSDSVQAQVINTDGSCFEATVEATQEKQNDDHRYKGSKNSTTPPPP